MPGLPIAYEVLRVRTRDAGDTTVYVTRHPLDRTSVRLVCFPAPTRLDHWCVANGEPEAILAGFFLRDPDRPLGQVVLGGRRLGHGPIARRTGVDAGLELGKLARLLVNLGANGAINLDGGGSATLIHHKHPLDRPYSDFDQPAPESRPVVTALLLAS